MSEIITIGEPMVMFLADTKEHLSNVEHFTRLIAGAELNVAMGLRRLGHTVTYISQVGEDPFGQYVKKYLENENIDTTFVKTYKEASTGFQFKNRTDEGDPEVLYFRKGAAASRITKDILNEISFSDGKVLHITGIFPALSETTLETTFKAIEKAHENGMLVTFDPNPRPVLWESKENMIQVTNELAFKSDIVLPGFSEGKLFTGKDYKEEIADFYLDKGVKKVVIKMGTTGSYSREKLENGQIKEVECPSFEVPVLDTVGAGDGFAAGVISGILENLEDNKILERGNAIGGIQVMHLSDNEGLPTVDELDNFLKNYKRKVS
ncbi:sugar kinase [Clostridium beijerinckii]|uniref:2-dehydro-3-deoxygluconokinase n=1 Tax=Clostridium beijerinckii TaxID=1520 RepID=A0A9Q5CIQ2_CLOBE|nr:sugar kinase [Clostridium beijerinckii]AQS07507.1 2-dehydro-3-deoxygluconokinase [Clostridium beijerinckii]MBA2884429.1 2-dehydro-3-deoxygluconokinase [Clostridium beijerinckii]MBA2898201.1 2-dehydro-3-deoxygluconokinase [Clostridium beijerinckii]MBA2912744.1 2-dehydro-3-deoxygluconokinase [Clostridium beijerinckii]MBA9012857.1 2-dehydro-3-deoxygluconokinase [Clostridium beijerinckii]